MKPINPGSPMATRINKKSNPSVLVEQQLDRYRSMRDFHLTAEPSGSGTGKSSGDGRTLPFVVQKHAASRLHYDFRLGWNGVLKSWAVAKGPSDFPGDKRLAVQVEDHPLEYAGFEGTIPKGQYGGGTVMVWDFGDWKPMGDVDRGLREGHLKFELHGKKLKGAWALVRMNGRASRDGKESWLLIKEKDGFARSETDPAITDKALMSAITKRSMEEIAESEDHVWHSSGSTRGVSGEDESKARPATSSRASSKTPPTRARNPSRRLKSAPQERFPGFIAPQLAQQATTAPDEADWIHELKLDGYRIQIHVRSVKRNGRTIREASLLTRKGLDWTKRMPDVAQAATELEVKDAILDGEAVVLDKNGVSSFAELQAAFQEGKDRYITYFAFDLLHLDGQNLRELPLTARKELLAGVLSGDRDDTPIRLSDHFEAKGTEVFQEACKLGAEGIVSKLGSGAYVSGRGSTWRKVKCIQEQEFVIVGFTPPSKGGLGIGALLLGYYEAGELRYAGRSGTGFTQKTSGDLRSRLNRLIQKKTSLATIPRDARRDVVWVKPELVAQISFATWTKEQLVRQAAFKGLREDKPANEVEREKALSHGKDSRNSSKQIKSPANSQQKGIKEQEGTPLPITHPMKVLDPESGMTKQMLAEYYLAVASHMLPHIADRPLSVVRCPEGCGKPCFFQKHIGSGVPNGISSVPVPNRKTGKKEEFLTLDSADGLLGLAQIGVLEIHPWGSRNSSLDQPDRIIFDLDPDEAIHWQILADTARDLRARLKRFGLISFAKLTGGKGLHVVAPIEPEHDWPTVKEFAHCVVLRMEKERPDLYVTKMTKAIRKDRIYLDYLRNDREATSIAPYSPRARRGAPVAVPLSWSELASETAPAFHVADFAQWRSRLNRDPWKDMLRIRQSLSSSALESAQALLRR
jgi:bifunctional non-homologous end joining protein LigD